MRSGRRALASFSTNSEGKEGKGPLRKPTDFMASFVRRASFVGSPQIKLARMVEPAWPPCWASSLIAMLQLARKL